MISPTVLVAQGPPAAVTLEFSQQFFYAGDPLNVTTQVLEGRGKKMRLFHRLCHADGRLLATGEQLLIHVNLETRRSSEPAPAVTARLSEIASVHAGLPAPD